MESPSLKREVGVFGATMMGLGSIIGTGVFVSIAVAAGAAGPSVVLALAVGALVALCNGLSSAQLAANHPLSGGTYEYGYRWLRPEVGFIAGAMFLCAKSASAATAALGFAGYLLNTWDAGGVQAKTPLALLAVFALTALVLTGIRRTNRVNVVIVSVTLSVLLLFVAAGLAGAWKSGAAHLRPFFAPSLSSISPLSGFLEACALMFVAYTGYGRIATLGEEIHDPRRNIPLAMTITLLASMAIYISVGLVAVATVGAEAFAAAGERTAAPLEFVARTFATPGAAQITAMGAMTAMLGVLLNLLLGLSRVVLAMARRGDLPAFLSRIDDAASVPRPAVILVAVVIGLLALIGNVKATWSFSAFTVLIYYAITNLAALRLSASERLYPRWIAWAGLLSCLFLAFWVEPKIWASGLAIIAGSLLARFATRKWQAKKAAA